MNFIEILMKIISKSFGKKVMQLLMRFVEMNNLLCTPKRGKYTSLEVLDLLNKTLVAFEKELFISRYL